MKSDLNETALIPVFRPGGSLQAWRAKDKPEERKFTDDTPNRAFGFICFSSSIPAGRSSAVKPQRLEGEKLFALILICTILI